MRICFIGNSHIAALKYAADSAVVSSDHTLSFFGSSASSARTLKRCDGKLISDDASVLKSYRMTHGSPEIVLREHDVFVLVAMSLNFRHVLGIAARHVRVRDAERRPKHALLSDEAFTNTLKDIVAGSIATHLVTLLEEERPQTILFTPSPCPSEDILADPSFASTAREAEDPVIACLYEDYLSAAAHAAAEVGAKFLPQNSQTLLAPGFTHRRYSSGSGDIGWSKTSATVAKRGDVWHMNGQYGARWLDDIMSTS